MNLFSEVDNSNEHSWAIRRSDMQESYALACEAYNQSIELNYDDGKHISLLNKGIYNIYHNNYKLALKQLFTALKYFNSNNFTLHQTRALNSIGMVYIIQGDFTKALLILNRGLDIAGTLEDTEMLVYILYNIAEIYKFSYNLYDRAIPYLKKASAFCSDPPHVLCGAVLSSLSSCLQHVGKTSEALEYAHDALLKAEASQDYISLGLCHEMICSLKKDMNELEDAWSHCEKSLHYRSSLNDEFASANVWLVMSQICLQKQSYNEALNYANQAISTALDSQMDSILYHLYLVKAKALHALGNFEESIKYYEQYIAKNNERVSKELENRISILTSEMKNRELEKDMEIFRLKNIELRQKNNEIELINKIGQQLTSSLDLHQIIQQIYARINQLMDAPFLGIGLYDSDLQSIQFIHLKERSEDFPMQSISLNDSRSYAVKCFESGKTLYVPSVDSNEANLIRFGNALSSFKANTVLYTPLLISSNTIGVITIQSDSADAYSKADIDFFVSISNFIAIAVHNAYQQKKLTQTSLELSNTLKELQDTQTQLIQAEKFASLGSLIAGVAHEINTPLGTSITLSSYITEEHDRLQSNIEHNKLTKSDLDCYMTTTKEAIDGLHKNLNRTADIVNSFKMVAIDQSTLNIRRFNVFDYVNDILLAYRSKYANTNHKIRFDCDKDLEIESYPGIFAHIISHLLANSLDHAFSDTDKGHIIITITAEDDQLHLQFCDNGSGISDENLNRVFDPFFSTGKSSGNIGLGLHTIHNMVTQLLKGTIRINSNANEGVCVDIFTYMVLNDK